MYIKKLISTLSLCCLLFYVSACSTVEVTTSGNEVFYVSAYPKSDEVIELELKKDFYFWGLYPKVAELNLQDETKNLGLYNPSFVSVEQFYTKVDILYGIVTLGLYMPSSYKITLLTNRELK